ncbi:ABC transporter substrate-binding protein [Xanthomonadaceae bacterium JHOS43]|nr:ABC transporter substrate-binding protein [Xanthomonadaceae bacterium JHOS43]MCX7564462.1 ABC transporter substrate-binding protein [Xanthomonadaceae bacterium XH05]
MSPRIILALLLTLFSAIAASSQSVAPVPADIVRERTHAVLDAIEAQRDAFRADPDKLRSFVKTQLNDVMDRPYAAQLVLARHARGASVEQIEGFADALTDSLLRRYADALLDVDPGTDVKIASSTPMRNGEMMRVASRIVRRAGEPVQVDYMFRRKGDDWLVFDVIVEGISYVQTYRNQFDGQLRTRSLDEVIAGLRSGQIRLQDES